jgi:asparagine synthase (glutamine-hydrolysing)
MGDAIAHRGPDGYGELREAGVGLIHRRLAIIDLAGGDQPIFNEDGSLGVVFNGEIYNYQHLRTNLESRGHVFKTNSDTETLVHLYEEHGAALSEHLRGMFAFALWDRSNKRLTISRDRLGQKPLFIYRDDEKVVFGSELKAILAHPNIDRTIDPAAIEDYLTFGVVPGTRSIFKRIEKLRSAHTVVLSSDKLHETPKRYWQLEYKRDESRSADEWAEVVGEKITESVQAHRVADVPIGAFLSGGLDSSAIVATLSGLSDTPVQTFSIGFQEREFSELPHARRVADQFGTKHVEEIVTAEAISSLDDLTHFYDEPFADASAIPTMCVSRVAAQHVKVVLSGDGGDEAFGGYARYQHDLKEAKLRTALPGWFRKVVLGNMASVWPKADWLPRVFRWKSLLTNLSNDPAAAYANTLSIARSHQRRQLLTGDLRNTLAKHRPEDVVEAAFTRGHIDPLAGMLSADVDMLLPDDFLTKVDRASMAYGLEVRPPLIDHELMELAATVPSDLKVRNGETKWLMKQIFEPKLPKKLAHRTKQGFEIPTDDWLRGELGEQVREVVLKPGSQIAEYVNQDYAAKLFDMHCRRTGRHGQLMWSLLVLGRWLDHYCGPETTSARPKPMLATK